MVASLDLLRVEHGDHLDVGSTDAHRDELAPRFPFQVHHLVVDDVTSRLPECLARRDLARLLALDLEQDLSLEYITEHGAGVTVRGQSRIGRRKFEELRHHMGALGDPRRSDVDEI
jgi:hypothetical protein